MSGHERSLFYSLPNSKLTLIREGRAVPLRGAVGTDDTVLSWERLCLATSCLYYGGRATRRPTTSNGPQRTPTRASIAPASSSDTAPARFSHETGCDLGRFPIRACSCVPLLVIVCGLSSKRHAQSQFERGGQGAELGFCCLHGCQFCDCVRFEKTNRTQSQNRHSWHARELGFCDCGGRDPGIVHGGPPAPICNGRGGAARLDYAVGFVVELGRLGSTESAGGRIRKREGCREFCWDT